MRGVNTIALPRIRAIAYGLNSLGYLASNKWNSLNDNASTAESPTIFKRKTRSLTFLLFFVILICF